jgi:DNA recombination protein RmuC
MIMNTITIILITLLAAAAVTLLFLLVNKTRQWKAEAIELKNEINTLKEENISQLTKLNETVIKLSVADETNINLKDMITGLQKEKAEIDKNLANQFELLATKILKSQSFDFKTTSKEEIERVLNPLGERIKRFETLVKETWDKEQRESISLREAVKQLTTLNQSLSEETAGLTRALKADTKQQGNWGEMVLESILERSGLQKGINYETQFSTKGLNDETIRPDVLIRLPEKKHLIVDAKVSLSAFERYINAEEDKDQKKAIAEHIHSVRAHVKELYDKSYQRGKDVNSPDFILMFMPIEASFSAAVKADESLFQFAWERNIVIVSPSTLLATLMTIANIWRQENQKENAREIAKTGGQLFDKVAGILEDFEKMKKQLQTVDKTVGDMESKFTGRGGLVSKVDKMREMGASTSKKLPAAYEQKENDTFDE